MSKKNWFRAQTPLPSLECGNWGELKAEFFALTKFTKNFHSDIIYSYQELEKFIEENKYNFPWRIVVSFHTNGSNVAHEGNKEYLHRIKNTEGRSLVIDFDGETVSWRMVENELVSIKPRTMKV